MHKNLQPRPLERRVGRRTRKEVFMISESIIYTWHTAKDLPTSDGISRLVMLSEDNEIGWTSKRPVTAEFGVLTANPTDWTVYDGMENVIITDDVIFWTDLPNPPNA